MRPISRCVALGAVVVLVVASGNLVRAHEHETPGEHCAIRKIVAAAAKIAELTACDAAALHKGVPVDPKCVAKAQNAFQTFWMAVEEASLKILPKGVGCATTGDVVTIENKVDAHRLDLQQTLDIVAPNVQQVHRGETQSRGEEGGLQALLQ